MENSATSGRPPLCLTAGLCCPVCACVRAKLAEECRVLFCPTALSQVNGTRKHLCIVPGCPLPLCVVVYSRVNLGLGAEPAKRRCESPGQASLAGARPGNLASACATSLPEHPQTLRHMPWLQPGSPTSRGRTGPPSGGPPCSARRPSACRAVAP